MPVMRFRKGEREMEWLFLIGGILFAAFLIAAPKQKKESNCRERMLKRAYKSRDRAEAENVQAEKTTRVQEWLMQGVKVYRSKTHLMTPTEQRFYHFVQKKFGADKRVFAQVRVVDVINVNWSAIKKGSFDEQIAFRQVSQWHVDYVITDQDFKIICAVELDDKSHEEPDRQRRDWILERAFDSAEVKLYRFKLKENDERINDPAYVNF